MILMLVTGPGGLALASRATNEGSGTESGATVKIESPAMASVSGEGTTAKVMRPEPSDPVVAWTRALPGVTPVRTPVAGSIDAVGSAETQVTATAALSPFLSSGLAVS